MTTPGGAEPSPSDYSPVTSDTFNTFVWTNQTSVCIVKCLDDILPVHLLFCFDTLVHIKFSSLTKVSNIKSILSNCPNLTHLTFNDALIDDYRKQQGQGSGTETETQPSSSLFKISNLAVQSLTIICPLELSKNEYWLLEFFTNEVELPNLASLSFYSFTAIGGGGGGMRGPGPLGLGQGQGQGQGQGGGHLIGNNLVPSMWKEAVEVMNKYGPEIDTRVVCKFLLKYRSSIQKLWIGRPGFDVNYEDKTETNETEKIESEPEPETEVERENRLMIEKLKEIRLTFLSVSIGSSGVNFLLKTQNHLKTLNLVSNINLRLIGIPNISILMNNIFECISKNTGTLKEVKLVPTIITGAVQTHRRSLMVDQNILNHFTVDCISFSECTSLKYLCLSLRAYRDEFEMMSDLPPLIQGTKLKNMHLIPVANLVELCIPVEEYSRDELEKLAEKFSEFRNLKKFYFGTSQLNPVNSFLIRLVWIETLVGLPCIEKVVFHNGVLQDVDGTRRVIQGMRMNIGGNRNNLNLNDNGANVDARNEIENASEAGRVRENVAPIITMIYDPPRYTFEISRRPRNSA